MIEIKVWAILGQAHIEAEIHGGPFIHSTKVTWQEPLGEKSPLHDLTSAVTRALEALDGVAGEVVSDLSGTG